MLSDFTCLSPRKRHFQRSPSSSDHYWQIVGDFQWGPVQEIVSIDSENELVDTFGKPTTSVFYDHMVASSFLAYGSELLVVREVR